MEEPKVNDFTLEELCDAIQKTVERVPTVMNNPEYNDYIRIVLIGATGVGKSTLLHILAGDKMIVECTDKDMLFKCPKTKMPHIIIGDGIKSVTVLPGVYVDHKNKFIYIDTPGLLDSEGVFQRILNAYSIHTVLKAGGKMKLLFVIDRGSFYSKRGGNAIENFDIISQLIDDPDILRQCLVLAITKTRKKDDIMGFFNYLKSGEDDLPWLIDYFMNEGNTEMFMVPEAEDEGYYNNFKEFDRVYEILRLNPADSPENRIIVDQDCKDQLKILAKQLKNQAICAIENFKIKIPSLYENEKNIEKLEDIDNKISSLLDASKQDLEIFSHQVSTIFPDYSKEIQESISEMKPWKEFLIEILDDDDVEENVYVDLSSLIESLYAHLNNIRQLKKEHQENAEHLTHINTKIKEENLKYAKDVNLLEQKAQNNEITQEEKQRQLETLRINHERQTKKIQKDKNEFEKNSQAAMNDILKTIKLKNEEDKERLSIKIQKINDDFHALKQENAVLQCRLEYERLERERREREWKEQIERERIEKEKREKEIQQKNKKHKAKILAQKVENEKQKRENDKIKKEFEDYKNMHSVGRGCLIQ